MNCWFCTVREAETDHVYHVEMYGDVDTRKTPSQTKVAYNVRHLDVPRCADCHSRHVIAFYALIATLGMLVALIAAVLAALYGWVPPWAWGLWAGLAGGLLIGNLIIRLLILKGILSIRQAKAAYPEIKTLLEKSYRFGHRPRGHLPESDKPDPDPKEEKAPNRDR